MIVGFELLKKGEVSLVARLKSNSNEIGLDFIVDFNENEIKYYTADCFVDYVPIQNNELRIIKIDEIDEIHIVEKIK